jgi:hypothetical protein
MNDALGDDFVPNLQVRVIDSFFPRLFLRALGLGPLSLVLEGREEEGEALHNMFSHCHDAREAGPAGAGPGSEHPEGLGAGGRGKGEAEVLHQV